jgi:hypothetical protein
MSFASTRLSSSPASAANAIRLAALTCLAAALALMLTTTLRVPIKDDIAWLFYVSEQWLAGRRLYVDLVEVNPPLIVWLYAIPVRLAQLLGLAPRFVAMPAFAALILACAWWTVRLLNQAGRIVDTGIAFAVIGCVLLLIPGGEFGQREHLLVAAALPYLVLVGNEMCGARPSTRQAVMVGVVAALGCALKPRYLIAFGSVEIFAMLQGARLARPVSLAAAATLGLYGVAIACFTPSFFSEAVPMALGLYGAGDSSFGDLVWESRPLLLGLAAAALLLATSRPFGADTKRPAVIILFAAAATVVCVIQGKNWFYHRLPATISAVLGLVGLIYPRLRRGNWRVSWQALAPAMLAAIALTAFGQRAYDRLHPQIEQALERDKTIVARLDGVIRHEHARTYIAFSEWIALGFPVVNETGVAWASRFDSMWPLHALISGGGVTSWPVADWVVADFLRVCPDIAVVDRRGSADYVALLGANHPDFRGAWALYHPIAAFNGVMVFRNRATNEERLAKSCGTP